MVSVRLTIVCLALALGLVGSADGEAAEAPIALTPSTVDPIATVTVRDLPPERPGEPSIGAAATQEQLPFLVPDPAAYQSAKLAAEEAGGQLMPETAIGPSATLEIKLPSPLSSDDDPRDTPPDMGFAVGGGFKMEQINLTGRIWDSTNAVVLTFDLAPFFISGRHAITDPWVIFDQASGRWFAGIFDINDAAERLAVSTSSDPTSTWLVYEIVEGGCPDQGKIGVSDLVVAISANEFSSCAGSHSYLGVIISVLNKAQLVAGMAVDVAQTPALPAYFSSVPAQSLSPTTDQWFAAVNVPSSGVAHILRSTGVPPAAVSLSEAYTPPISSLATPPDAKQRGTTQKVATGDDRVQTAAWRSDSLVFTAGDRCIPAGDLKNRACGRLLAVNTTTGAVTIDTDIANKRKYIFYPAAQPNLAGSIVVGYGRSGKKLFPQLDAVVSTSGGSLGTPLVIQTGNAANKTGRYGDYFAVSIDPDGTTAWVAGEVGGHNHVGGWGTAAASVIPP